MTAAPSSGNTDSYSTRTCRCGHPMLRQAAWARIVWVCPSCGRLDRR